jgi:hypothetical protein
MDICGDGIRLPRILLRVRAFTILNRDRMKGPGWIKKGEWRELLFKEQGGFCFYCHKKMSLTNRRKTGQPAKNFATFEHLQRRVDGGKFDDDNIVLVHRTCNTMTNIEAQRDPTRF